MTASGTFDSSYETQGTQAKKRLTFAQRRRQRRLIPIAAMPQAAFEQPVYVQRTPFGSAYIVNDSAGVKRVMVDNVANYPKTVMERQAFSALFGDGLLSTDGETWRTHRRIMAPSFDPRSVASYASVMAKTTEEFRQVWDQQPDGVRIDISEQMTALTLRIISKTMFSDDETLMTGITGGALHESQDAFDFNILDILPIIGPMRMKKRMQAMSQTFAPMDGAIGRLIEARKAYPSAEPDLLGRLVAAMDEDTGARMTAKEVRDQVLTIFIAGHETTASAMTFVWWMLSQHPAVEAKLHAELQEVLGGRTPGEADVPKLVYAKRIIDETLRLYPSAPGLSARVALEADEICGVKIPKGATVAIAPWLLHHRRANWENPERFDPDRFSPARSAGRPRFAYMPFGAGPRICIGAVLATTEATLILATLAQRYHLRLPAGHEVELRHRVTLRPEGGLPMILERRA
ncbi:MAG: cytochrome P450 [Caulobacterales bacterium]